MSKINRSDVIQKAVNDLSISGNDKVPSESLDKIQLTYSLNPEYANVAIGLNQSTTGTFTLYTTSTTKDFYLSSLIFSMTKDATCDVATGTLNISSTINGIARTLGAHTVITLTAQSEKLAITFAKPIKLDRGVTITVPGTFTLGVMSRFAGITGIEKNAN